MLLQLNSLFVIGFKMVFIIIVISLIAIVPAVIIFFVVGKNLPYADIFLSILFFMLCIYLGFSNDFAAFFFGPIAFLCLFFASSAVVFDKFKENKSVRNLLISILLIIFAPVAGYSSHKLYPYLIFYQWALFHPTEFLEVKGEEGFLKEIDSWGFAGMDSSLMLASSQNYDLTVSDDLKLWKMKNKITCDVARVYKVYPKMYTIFPYTETNCDKGTNVHQ